VKVVKMVYLMVALLVELLGVMKVEMLAVRMVVQ
jgi:hypothetical protein